MPWRALPGQVPDPYHVWLSEIMLQQTTVAAVFPYFERFLRRFPTLGALATAPQEAVLQAWAGLGYYARARNLHGCAGLVAAQGGFPKDLSGLRALPGIGEYTAAAIASIAFGVPVVPVDGNVARVAARIFAIEEPLPAARGTIAAAAYALGQDPAAALRPGDFTQALFDLGATVCMPRAPVCQLCPWRGGCAARIAGIAAALPRKVPKRTRPLRFGAQFWLEDSQGWVLLRRRPSRGLLGGMLELPGTEWRGEPWAAADAMRFAPQPASWQFAGQARHGFTHFELRLDVYRAAVDHIDSPGLLRSGGTLDGEALPAVMQRCVRIAKEKQAPFISL